MTLNRHGTPRRVRVFTIDDNEEFLRAIEFLLKLDPRLCVLNGARWDQNGLGRAARLQADLVLMDVAAPIRRGVDAIRQVKALPHAPHVIVLTLNDQADYRRASISAGADGFISKSQVGRQLPPMIRSLFPDVFEKRTL